MTSQLPTGATRAESDEAKAALAQLEADYAQLVADGPLAAASMLPPPAGTAADAASLLRSIYRLDGWGVFFDGVGFLPLAGDAIKAGRLGRRALKFEAAISAAKLKLLKQTRGLMDARKAVAKRYWDDILTKGRRRFDEATSACTTQACREQHVGLIGDHYKYTPVKDGRWTGGLRGDGVFVPDKGSKLGDALVQFNANPKLRPTGKPLAGIPYKDGFPIFDEFVVPAGAGRAQVEIFQSTSRLSDFAAADEALEAATGTTREALTDLYGDLTWHHHQDSVTIQLVPSNLHGARNGTGHTGGVPLNRREEF